MSTSEETKTEYESLSATMLTEMEINGENHQVPNSYICPITLEIMTHPLVTRNGLHFERSAIFNWLEKSATCPLTRRPMQLSDLIHDRHLANEIQFWKEYHGILPRKTSDEEKENGPEEEDSCSFADYSFVGFVSIPATPERRKGRVPRRDSTGRAAGALRRIFRRNTAAASSAWSSDWQNPETAYSNACTIAKPIIINND